MDMDIRRVISEDFWIDQLRGFEPHGFIPLNRQQDISGSTQSHVSSFPQPIRDRLNEVTKGIPTNAYVLMAAAVAILLSRYMNTQDILIVTPRLQVSQTTGNPHAGILFLRLPVVKDGTIRNLLQIIQTTVTRAHKHQDYDLEALLRRLGAEGRNPDALFQVGFSYSALNQNHSFDDKLTLRFQIEESQIGESQKQYTLAISYNDEIFNEAFINQIAAHLLRILACVVWHPDRAISAVELLSEAERNTLLETVNATQTSYPQQKPVIDWFEEQVERSPDAIAIVCEQCSLTYRDLNQQANQVAAYLQTQGVEPEHRVGLLLTRSEYLIIAILGVLKAGGAYLPIEPEFPLERIRYMVADSDCRIILSEASQQNKWAVGAVQVTDIRELPLAPATHLTRSGDPHQLAYLMYTSGSTGLPKGVAIEHRSLMNYLYWASEYYFEQNPDRGNMALFTSPAFDLTVTTIFLPLLRGKKLYIYPDNSPEVVLETCFREDSEIDAIKLTPSHIQILNYIPVTPSNIEVVIVGGEELKPTHIQLLKERNNSIRIYNEYGPTEATVGCTIVEANPEKITIGTAIANSQIYILDEDCQLQPLGVAGEICIGGNGLARGYWNREELTQERFIVHPFYPGKRVYRTGDLGRWLDTLELEYLGRKDSQVKIRGYRIELQEIEQQLLAFSQIHDVAVVTNDSSTDPELIAYVVGSGELNLEQVRCQLSEKLPAYMIPQQMIRLERLPLTANGKLAWRSLPKPEQLKPSSTPDYVAPRDQLEAQLVEIGAEVLKQDRIGINDNLLTLGANSLKIIQIVARVRHRLGVDLNLKEVFANLRMREIAELVRVKQPLQLPPIELVTPAEHYALSQSQRQFWTSAQIGAAIAYNIPGAVVLEGSLNRQALLKAFRSLVERHEVLRTTFICVDGEPRQWISPDSNFWLEERNLTGEAEPFKSARSWIEKAATLPFDLEKETLLRVYLWQLAPMRHLLLINTHHIIFDGWSIGLLLQELTTLYEAYQNGQDNPLQPLEFQYKDYATWQNTFLNSHQARVHQAYWQQKLQDLRPLDLPTDYPRSTLQTFQGAVIPLNLSTQLVKMLEEFSKQHEVSQFAIVLAVIKALLHRYTSKADIIVATPVSERTQADWETQIGLYLNTVVLRDHVSGQDRFVDLLQRVKQTALDAFIHQIYPFNKLVQELPIQRDLSHNPVFDVGYTWMDEIGSQIEQIILSHIKVTQIPLEHEQKTAVTDLWFYFESRGDCIAGYLTYNCNLFREETAHFINQALIKILEQVLNNPELEINVLNLADEVEMTKAQITVELNL
ncbi:hypothetical protein C7B65_17910 [Phormidesmis priestleyi ULC007]|uniref:Carrier domain-containing protein n=1 Tax=Phormidesmis priestleyi ULC007 TaxID=1920490 RepID=A0A2T1DB39_9CYAN|nr:non-ribosomal peptide synthetase [Phormidesmis priestleyi]PSB17674.1 hypothetical protein C7B65_17910 [Phormidesmis priestleyi ULC007]